MWAAFSCDSQIKGGSREKLCFLHACSPTQLLSLSTLLLLLLLLHFFPAAVATAAFLPCCCCVPSLMLMLLHFFPAAAAFLHCTSSLLLLLPLHSFPAADASAILPDAVDADSTFLPCCCCCIPSLTSEPSFFWLPSWTEDQ